MAAALLAALGAGCASVHRSDPGLEAGGDPLAMAAPESAEQRAYLGLPPQATHFRIGDLTAEGVVVICFDLYCPTCQRAGRFINQLYQLVQDRGLGERLKFIGLGVGDTPLETAIFRDKYQVLFPVFPDRSNALARQFGTVHVPGLFLVRPGSPPTVLFRHAGSLRDPEVLLGELLRGLEADEGQAPAPGSAMSDPIPTEVCQPGVTCPASPAAAG